MKLRERMSAHDVSEATARRWLRGDLTALIARHVARRQLREACARNGVPMHIAHQRKWEGWPSDALALPMKRSTMRVIDTPESRELAERYGVSLATATRWVERGKDECARRFLDRQRAAYGVNEQGASAHGWST